MPEEKQEVSEKLKRDLEEMSKAVMCLALELPESVHDDVVKRWNAVLSNFK